MLPITDAARAKRDRFQQFLFNGFMNRDALKKAIFEQHPDLTEETIESELDKLDEYVQEADDAANIMSGLVEFQPNL